MRMKYLERVLQIITVLIILSPSFSTVSLVSRARNLVTRKDYFASFNITIVKDYALTKLYLIEDPNCAESPGYKIIYKIPDVRNLSLEENLNKVLKFEVKADLGDGYYGNIVEAGRKFLAYEPGIIEEKLTVNFFNQKPFSLKNLANRLVLKNIENTGKNWKKYIGKHNSVLPDMIMIFKEFEEDSNFTYFIMAICTILIGCLSLIKGCIEACIEDSRKHTYLEEAGWFTKGSFFVEIGNLFIYFSISRIILIYVESKDTIEFDSLTGGVIGTMVMVMFLVFSAVLLIIHLGANRKIPTLNSDKILLFTFLFGVIWTYSLGGDLKKLIFFPFIINIFAIVEFYFWMRRGFLKEKMNLLVVIFQILVPKFFIVFYFKLDFNSIHKNDTVRYFYLIEFSSIVLLTVMYFLPESWVRNETDHEYILQIMKDSDMQNLLKKFKTDWSYSPKKKEMIYEKYKSEVNQLNWEIEAASEEIDALKLDYSDWNLNTLTEDFTIMETDEGEVELSGF